MNVTGIIAEYNPFHRGHKYQINYCKKELQADYVIVVMSGDYVQRGTPALLPKHLRAEMALRCGADLVLEMPVSVSTASAEHLPWAGFPCWMQSACGRPRSVLEARPEKSLPLHDLAAVLVQKNRTAYRCPPEKLSERRDCLSPLPGSLALDRIFQRASSF